MSRTDAVRVELDGWREQCRQRPGELPDGCEPVQTRLIRSVGRGRLPDGKAAFVKVMAFPRVRDRVRYLFRALPARHEAAVLGGLADRAPDVPCPLVLDVVDDRHWAVPHLSVLVTAALPERATGAPDFGSLVRCAARLADVGLFHPDLNPDNFVPLRDGRIAILDLQSARLLGAPLRADLRRRMAAKLWITQGLENGDPAAFVEAGLVSGDDLPILRAEAERLGFEQIRRRVERCFLPSTEFEVRRRWNGAEIRRRSISRAVTRVPGGRDTVKLWLGDRVAEVLDGDRPVMAGLFRKSWWLPGRNAAYIPTEEGPAVLARHESRLIAHAERWERAMRSGVCRIDRDSTAGTHLPVTDH